MTYNKTDYEKYYQKVLQIQAIDWVQNHLDLMEKPNFWSILEYGEKSKSAHEVRTSRMLRWLLDANANHGLGNVFAQQLIQLIGGDYTYDAHKNTAIQVTAEEKRIDVLYKDDSQQIILAIEVKQFAEEGIRDGVSQLDRYEEIVEGMIKGQEAHIRPYYIYLTPTGEKGTNDKWMPVSYKNFIDIIRKVQETYLAHSTHQYRADTAKILQDFKDDLQRSIDFLEKDRNDINQLLTKKEKDLTKKLAMEIQHETDGKHLQQLQRLKIDEAIPLHDVILMMNSALTVQNHTTNVGVQIFTRKVYNYFTAENQLATDPEKIERYKVNETFAPIQEALLDKLNLPFDHIMLTSLDGQGLYFYPPNETHRFYFSGDWAGSIPNDGLQALTISPKAKILEKSASIRGEKFYVNEALIVADKVQTTNGHVIDLKTFIEDYLVVELQQLQQTLLEKNN